MPLNTKQTNITLDDSQQDEYRRQQKIPETNVSGDITREDDQWSSDESSDVSSRCLNRRVSSDQRHRGDPLHQTIDSRLRNIDECERETFVTGSDAISDHSSTIGGRRRASVKPRVCSDQPCRLALQHQIVSEKLQQNQHGCVHDGITYYDECQSDEPQRVSSSCLKP